MVFPAAPTESGTAKIHFLTTDGNAAGGWFSVVNFNTTIGTNPVGFAAVATHVSGNPVAEPGGLPSGSIPLVLIGGDDGTNVMPLQLDASDFLKVVLQANSGVDIGDVDVTSLPAITNGGTFAVQIVDPSFANSDGNALGEGVLIQGDDGTDRKNINVDASTGDVQVDVTNTVTVDLGADNDVTITAHVPGTGATNLGKAVDSVPGATDTGIAALAIRDDALTTLTPVDGDYTTLRVSSTGALHVTGGGGGTQFNVDAALGGTPEGTLAIAKRDDALSALSPVEGDAVELRVDANGALWTHDDALDGAIAGSELQVDIVDHVPGTGATNLGKAIQSAQGVTDTGVAALGVRNDTLADLSGADGDYAPLQFNALGALYVASIAAGDIANSAADSGNPVKIGGQANSAEPTAVAAGERVNAWFDRYGRAVVIDGHPDPEDPATATLTAASDAEVIAAPGASVHIYITGIQVSNASATKTRLDLREGPAGTIRKSMALAADGGGFVANFKPFWKLPANTALTGILSGAVTDVRVNVDYYLTADV